ncbi:hypothetical protein VB780_03430 [Leptolyngbya sp. CCNP1308]|nr:hypothetical protein [Leptolyngbya sp. CCNP1308]MEA5447606.1 hypothetical protein [Leptolyngbya sp. CCNP1308]
MTIKSQMEYLGKLLPGMLDRAVIENTLRLQNAESKIEKGSLAAANN